MVIRLVTSLRDHYEQERQAVMAQHPDDVEKATRLLINRLLHRPSENLRSMAAMKNKKEWEQASQLVERLFLKEKDDT